MRNRQQYNAGYAWAAVELLSKCITPEDLEKQAADDHDFDRGALQALSDWSKVTKPIKKETPDA